MLSQKNPQLSRDVHEVGCYMLVFMEWNAVKFQKDFVYDEANALWEKSMKAGYIVNDKKSDDYRKILKPDEILKEAMKMLIGEYKGRWAQIGEYKNGKLTYWGWVTDGWKNAERFTAAMEVNPETGGTHWVSVKSIEDPTILYDSWNLARIGEKSKAKRFVIYAFR